MLMCNFKFDGEELEKWLFVIYRKYVFHYQIILDYLQI